VEVSDSGCAPKNEPDILALAIAAKQGDEPTRQLAFATLAKVCRTGTHLFQFVAYIDAMGGWGRGARRSVSGWYISKDAADLAYQLVKYRQRGGWTHADVLRLTHPRPTGDKAALLAFVANKAVEGELPPIVIGYFEARHWKLGTGSAGGRLTGCGVLRRAQQCHTDKSPSSRSGRRLRLHDTDRRRNAGAMALIIARTEPNHLLLGLNTAPVELRISPKMRLDAAMRRSKARSRVERTSRYPPVGSRPSRMTVDGLITLTDNETWAGRVHPVQAMAAFRRQIGRPVRNVVVAMRATGHSIGDPGDPLTLQCAGFDATIPEVIRGFVNAEY
jgi:hypothetical protein